MTNLSAKVANALKKEERILTLIYVGKGRSIPEISDEVNMSFAGVQSYVKDLEEVDLVRETDDGWRITETGEFVLEIFRELENGLQQRRREKLVSKFEELRKEADELGIDLSKADFDTEHLQ